MTEMKDKLIVALDCPSWGHATQLIDRVAPYTGMFKVGMSLFAKGSLIRSRINSNIPIFLDLKLHDIPNTVYETVRALRWHLPTLLTVHAVGGPEMIAAAKEAANRPLDMDFGVQPQPPKIIAVTYLTSDGDGEYPVTPDDAAEVAYGAWEAGADGVVCAVPDITKVREYCPKDFIIVTPGIRLPGMPKHDHKRSGTPQEAIRGGADYIVVGRPICETDDPENVTKQILVDMRAA